MKTYQIYSSVNDLPECWHDLAQHDIFLQKQYLKALEQACPKNINLYYIAVFSQDSIVGIAIVQHVQLYLNNMFRQVSTTCIQDVLKKILFKFLRGNILVVGNLTHTGQHGLYFMSSKIDFGSFLNEIYKALKSITIQVKSKSKKTIRMHVFKDYFTSNAITKQTQFITSNKLHKVFVQPNMLMPIDENWNDFKTYNAALNKKYRTRLKRAKKRLGEVYKKELSLNDIKTNAKQLHDLYLNVSNNAKFNTFILPENHFYSLKKQLLDNFKVYGYFLNDALVGFYTLIINNKHLETYFLGYDTAHQYNNQLYLNMLYDMAEYGINNKFKTVVYARTAMEIKSSVGAKPYPMLVYLKHTNLFLNAMLKPVFKFISPKQNWEERHPFKN